MGANQAEREVHVGNPLPTTPAERARRALAGLTTASGFTLGDVIARLILDSGIVQPSEELAELRAEVERLREFHHDVSESIKPYGPTQGTVTVAQRIGILGRKAKHSRDARDLWRETALREKARAEAAEAVLRAVEALADEWERHSRILLRVGTGVSTITHVDAVRRLRAVLDSHPTGTQEPTPDTGEAEGICQECGQPITVEQAASLGYYDGNDL